MVQGQGCYLRNHSIVSGGSFLEGSGIFHIHLSEDGSLEHKVLFVVGSPGIGKTTALRLMVDTGFEFTNDTEIRWTLKPPYAFIGHYENKILDGGDRVARHANLMCLEYWKRNILLNSQFQYTILDGEMYLWQRIFDELKSQRLQFVDPTDTKYHPGGMYYRELNRPVDKQLTPDLDVYPTVKLGCVHLVASVDVCLARRRDREAKAEAGATINSDRHMKTAASKQNNFAQKFQSDEDPFFLDPCVGGAPPLAYLSIDAERFSPTEISSAIRAFAEHF